MNSNSILDDVYKEGLERLKIARAEEQAEHLAKLEQFDAAENTLLRNLAQPIPHTQQSQLQQLLAPVTAVATPTQVEKEEEEEDNIQTDTLVLTSPTPDPPDVPDCVRNVIKESGKDTFTTVEIMELVLASKVYPLPMRNGVVLHIEDKGFKSAFRDNIGHAVKSMREDGELEYTNGIRVERNQSWHCLFPATNAPTPTPVVVADNVSKAPKHSKCKNGDTGALLDTVMEKGNSLFLHEIIDRLKATKDYHSVKKDKKVITENSPFFEPTFRTRVVREIGKKRKKGEWAWVEGKRKDPKWHRFTDLELESRRLENVKASGASVGN
jgi:hypothetical protein